MVKKSIVVTRIFILVILSAGFLTSCTKDFDYARSDPQTKVFWKLGYNAVRPDAPIHIHFAKALPSKYEGSDIDDWEWERWKAGTKNLLKDELFPLIGAYEHYYFLIDYERYDADDADVVALARTIGDNPGMTKDSFTGISGMHYTADGWKVPLHMSRIPNHAHMQYVLDKNNSTQVFIFTLPPPAVAFSVSN